VARQIGSCHHEGKGGIVGCSFTPMKSPRVSLHSFFGRACAVLLVSHVAVAPIRAQEIDAPVEKIFSGVKGTTSATQAVVVSNSGSASLHLTSASLTGPNPSAFTLVSPPSLPRTLAPGQSVTFNVAFKPGQTVGALSAFLRLLSDAVDEPTLNVGLYGLSAKGEQGSNEPTLNNIVKTLGYDLNVGSTGLLLGTGPEPIGDEVLVPLFVKATTGPVTMTAVARYSPDDLLDLGFYTKNGGTPVRTKVLTIALHQEQKLNPSTVAGGTASFDPGEVTFGFYSGPTSYAERNTYTEDSLNPPPAPLRHAVRIYPLKNRAGQLVENSYLVCMEPAKNGDYQDYLFVVTNVKPPAGAPAPRVFEAESLLPAAGSSGDAVRTLSETAASSGVTVMNDTNAVGDFLTFRLPGVPAGTYSIKVRCKRNTSRGLVQVQASVGGALINVGSPIDLYASSSDYKELVVGSWSPGSVDDNLISFRIVGKNSNSSGFTQCVDRITLVAP
jgi:hypothetical protein